MADGTEDQVLEHRFETGLKTLSSWVDAFFREGDSLLEALTSAATGAGYTVLCTVASLT